MKPSLTVIILTLNEALHLERCLESVRGIASEIMVVDSGSTDGTQEIARRCGATVVEHAFTNQADQFNWALDTVPLSGAWVLRLDADEYLLPELAREIEAACASVPSDVTGLYLKRRVYFMGRWIRHGGYYPTWILRLFRRGKARSENREVDEHITLLAGRAEELQNDFVDENLKGLGFWFRKHHDYAAREAAAVLRGAHVDAGALGGGQAAWKRRAKESFYYRLPPFLRPLLYFLYRYVLRFGFLDGVRGSLFHLLQGFWYRFLVDVNIWKRRLHLA